MLYRKVDQLCIYPHMHTCIPSFWDFLPTEVTTKHWAEIPVLGSRFSIAIYLVIYCFFFLNKIIQWISLSLAPSFSLCAAVDIYSRGQIGCWGVQILYCQGTSMHELCRTCCQTAPPVKGKTFEPLPIWESGLSPQGHMALNGSRFAKRLSFYKNHFCCQSSSLLISSAPFLAYCLLLVLKRCWNPLSIISTVKFM